MMGPKILAGIAAILLIVLIVKAVRSTKDAPQRLLEMAVRSLPDNRRDWGAAMTAELDRLEGRTARWSFALGCARAALIPPRSLTPVLLTAASATALAIAAGFAALDPMRPFIVTLLAAVGVAATITLARSKKLNPPGKTAGVVMVSGALASIAMTIYLLVRYPTGHDPVHSASSDGRNTSLLIAGAILITGYLWLTLTPPPSLATHPRAATIGTIAGLIYAGGYIPVQIFLAEPAVLYYLLAPIILFTAAAIRGGTVAALWAGLTGALWTFSIPLLAHFKGYQLDAIRLDDTEPGATPDPQLWFPSLLGQELGSAFIGLVFLPLWALLIGFLGQQISQAGQAFRREYART